MRFKLFGFKSNISILETNKEKKKKASKDDDNSTITCIGFRTYEEFDRPPIETREETNINQASTSTAKTKGKISQTKDKNKKKATPAPTPKPVNGNVSNSKTKNSGNIASKIKNAKKASASQPQLNAQPNSPPASQITNARRDTPSNLKPIPIPSNLKPIQPPTVPQETVKHKNPEEVPNHTNIPAASDSLIAAQSLPNLNHNQRSFTYDDDDNNSDNHASDGDSPFIVVNGRTAATVNDDNSKKSTLIFMTEDHGNEYSDEYDDNDEYEEDIDYYFKANSRNYGQTDNRLQEMKSGTNERNEYSDQAASIFFNESIPEPEQRVRKLKHRDDDDNGSQTSA